MGIRAFADLPIVGSWSSGNRWLMNCMVIASKQEMKVKTLLQVTHKRSSIAMAHSPVSHLDSVEVICFMFCQMPSVTYHSCPRRRHPASPACIPGTARQGCYSCHPQGELQSPLCFWGPWATPKKGHLEAKHSIFRAAQDSKGTAVLACLPPEPGLRLLLTGRQTLKSPTASSLVLS